MTADQKPKQSENEFSPLPEAAGIAWCDLYGIAYDDEENPHPVRINVTQRSAVSSEDALVKLIETLKAARQMHMYPWPPESVQVNARGNIRRDETKSPGESETPQKSRRRGSGDNPPSNDNGDSKEEKLWVEVSALELAKTTKGDKYIKVRTNHRRFAKFGVAAYLDSSGIPEEVVAMVESNSWSMDDKPVTGQELRDEFSDMQYALVQVGETGSKIIEFSEKQPK